MAARDRSKDPDAQTDSDAPDIVETILAEPVEVAPPPYDAPPAPVSNPQAIKGAPSGAGFLPALGGGVLAAAIGFGVSHFNLLNLAPQAPDLSALTDRLAAVEQATTETREGLNALRSAPAAPDLVMADRISALETKVSMPVPTPALDPLIARMDALETQLSEASRTGSGVSGAALSALQAEVRALKSAAPVGTEDMSALIAATETRFAETEAKTKALIAEATTLAADAKSSAALGQLRAALDTGGAYTASLSLLPDADIPAALSDFAQTGLPTLANLKSSFPQSARQALEAALRANAGESWTERVGTFLRNQTGARSLTPREGTDPDAILSRAEAALAAADLGSALQEIATLPPDAQSAMADWTSLAERRRAASAAIDALAAETGG
jgi:hypothetical protein